MSSSEREKRPDRGWTDLDGIRRKYAILERRIAAGEATGAELEEFANMKSWIAEREKEARRKWEKSFGS
jgi:hypothetical protein